MPDCVIKIGGKDYVPARAIPAVTANHFDPYAVTQLLGGDDRYIFARSYSVKQSSLLEIEPSAWWTIKDTLFVLREQGASYPDMIKAIPAGIVVPLDGLTAAFFDAFVDHRLTHTAADDELLSDPGFLTGPITQPLMDGLEYELVMEGMSLPTVETKLHIAPPNEEIETIDSEMDSVTEETSGQDETLSALFDPVPVESLEKMFPAEGKWKIWAERAAQNKLKVARDGRAKFNPYRAAMWFLNRGAYGWDLARCIRTLVANLPHRSRDKAQLLTGPED